MTGFTAGGPDAPSAAAASRTAVPAARRCTPCCHRRSTRSWRSPSSGAPQIARTANSLTAGPMRTRCGCHRLRSGCSGRKRTHRGPGAAATARAETAVATVAGVGTQPDLDMGRDPLRPSPPLRVRHRRHGQPTLDLHSGVIRGVLHPGPCRVRRRPRRRGPHRLVDRRAPRPAPRRPPAADPARGVRQRRPHDLHRHPRLHGRRRDRPAPRPAPHPHRPGLDRELLRPHQRRVAPPLRHRRPRPARNRAAPSPQRLQQHQTPRGHRLRHPQRRTPRTRRSHPTSPPTRPATSPPEPARPQPPTTLNNPDKTQ